ncbi:MAG: VWA domain-containing protein [Deltaproteobacteria bacterium]|nr:VWA domain-containing protein [Deltaproteobacteria bacterium]
MGFEHPAFLLLPVVWWLAVRRRRRQPGLPFAPVGLFAAQLRPAPVKTRLPAWLGTLLLLLLILAAAGFHYSQTIIHHTRESRWLMLVQDLSGSTRRPSGSPGKTLGDIALDGLKNFVRQRPPEDLIGLVAFSSYARLLAPLTFDREIIMDKLNQLDRHSTNPVVRRLSAGGATNVSYAVWLAMCSFFMTLPQEQRPSFAELRDLRLRLAGRREVAVPAPLQVLAGRKGLAIILFTDGRIKATAASRDLPDFITLGMLLKKLGIHLYLIAVDGRVDGQVAALMRQMPGRLFLLPGRLNREKMLAIYAAINALERNRMLATSETVPRQTRPWLTGLAFFLFLGLAALRLTPEFARW